MKIAIIDDKLLNIKRLAQMLGELGIEENQIAYAQTVNDGIQLLEAQEPDLLFLDIDLGHGYGFDILERTSYQEFELVFVTAHPNFALKSFQFNPIHYLVKPYTQVELAEALHRYVGRKSETETSMKPIRVSSSVQARIAFPENGKIHFVALDDIMYLESSNVYTLCHIQDKAPIVVSKSLSSYQDVLPRPDFCRIHERYIVNLNYVNSYTKGRGGEVELKNGTRLSVATRRKELFLQHMDQLAMK